MPYGNRNLIPWIATVKIKAPKYSARTDSSVPDALSGYIYLNKQTINKKT